MQSCSFVCTLPIEVLSTIFLFCLPDKDHVDDSRYRAIRRYNYIEPNHSQAPLLLTRVCHLWRETAISTPALWSSLAIKRAKPYPFLIQTWLERTKDMPISVSIDLKDGGEATESVWKIVCSHVHHWGRIRVLYPMSSSVTAAVKHHIAAPQLHEAYINTSGPSAGWWATIIENAPRLRRLAWSGPMPLALLSWNKLTHAELSFGSKLNPRQCLRILSSTPQLLHVEFHFPAFQLMNVSALAVPTTGGSEKEGIFPQSALKTLVHGLRSLRVYGNNAYVSELFGYLSLPRLTELHMPGSESLEADKLLDLIHRSSCLLTTLSFRGAQIPEVELFKVLKDARVSSLVKLAVYDLARVENNTVISDELLKGLSVGDGAMASSQDKESKFILPRLEVLELVASIEHCTDGLFTEMIESRYPGRAGVCTPLRRVKVHILHSVTRRDLERVEQLKSLGLDIELNSPFYMMQLGYSPS